MPGGLANPSILHTFKDFRSHPAASGALDPVCRPRTTTLLSGNAFRMTECACGRSLGLPILDQQKA
jgi:hypothetical protein